MKNAIWITILVTIAYAIYLLVFGSQVGLPVEQSVETFKHYGLPISSSFEISCWWNLWLSPLVVMLIAYCYNQELIIGKEPRNPHYPGEAQLKYSVKISIYVVTVASSVVALGAMVVHAILFPVWSNEVAGPLSSLFIGGYTWFASYFVFGFAMEFLRYLLLKVFIDLSSYTEDVTDKNDHKVIADVIYQENMGVLTKLGTVKTLPFTLGLTCGYILRELFSKISGFFSNEGDDFAG